MKRYALIREGEKFPDHSLDFVKFGEEFIIIPINCSDKKLERLLKKIPIGVPVNIYSDIPEIWQFKWFFDDHFCCQVLNGNVAFIATEQDNFGYIEDWLGNEPRFHGDNR